MPNPNDLRHTKMALNNGRQCHASARLWHAHSRSGGDQEARRRRLWRQASVSLTLPSVTKPKRSRRRDAPKCSTEGRSNGKMCLSSPSSGTQITVPSASSRPSSPVSKNSNSTLSIFISSTRPMRSNLATSWIREMRTAR